MWHQRLSRSTPLLLILYLPTLIFGHGYIKSPRSRNFVAYQDGQYWPLLEEDPKKDSCPHCLNRGGTLGRCGANNGFNYDSPKNAIGGPMGANPQAVYSAEEEITVDVVLTAHHKGHFVLKACPIAEFEVATQECFDQHPLTFVEDLLYGAPVDTNHPERGYIAPTSHPGIQMDNSGVHGYLFTHKYRLPSGLTGDLILLQWKYYTANSCKMEGYDDYPFPDSSWNPTVELCGNISPDGNSTPERFWNCAEISILSNGPVTPTTPAPMVAPVVAPVAAPVVAPVAAPVVAPVVSPVVAPVAGDDSRLVAYLGNWQTCPTASQVEKYTHIVIAFATSYTWNPSKNICSSTCQIDTPPICNNSPNQSLVTQWQQAGKKVLLGYGGAGMGGSWSSDVNDCWEYCFGHEQQVVNRLVEITEDLGLDGVDIDYEYFYEDNQNFSGFSKGAEAQKFLVELTEGLRNSLPTGSILTHAPMDSDVVEGTAYFNLLQDVSSHIDFLMPQYYNGVTRPIADGLEGSNVGAMSALDHYTTLVDDMFDGDPTKVVFGFCISDCSGTASNADGNQAAQLMDDLRSYYSCNGGAFFWVAKHDVNGEWSNLVSAETQITDGCSNGPISPPVTAPPTTAPTPNPSAAPTHAPSAAPVAPAPTTRPRRTPNPTPTPTSAPVRTSNPTPNPTSAPVSSPQTCCPTSFTGLRDHDSCSKYYHCVNGVVTGSPIACPGGTLFDKNLQNCNWESQVQCVPSSCGPPQSSPTEAPVTSPTEPCCPSGFTGLRDHNSCSKYYHCVNGAVSGIPMPCPGGTLFDKNLQNCNWESQVQCVPSSCGPPQSSPTEAPVTSPTEPCCPSGFTGLRDHNSCSKYYHCVNGAVSGIPMPCPGGTLFDKNLQVCNWESQVQCTPSPCSRRLRSGP